MKISKSDYQNREYLLCLRNIVKTENGYILQKVWKENENGEIVETPENKSNSNMNGFLKNCYLCIHNRGEDCLLRTKLENASENHYYPNYYTYKCDAFDPVLKLNLIHDEEEMIRFIADHLLFSMKVFLNDFSIIQNLFLQIILFLLFVYFVFQFLLDQSIYPRILNYLQLKSNYHF